MIKFLENQSKADFDGLPNDAALVKIKALMGAYGCKYSFLSFWFQKSETDKTTAAICRFESSVIICVSSDADCEEILQFIKMISCGEVFCKKNLCTRINLEVKYDCDELRFAGDSNVQQIANVVGFKEVYEILKSGSDGQIELPPYDDWYVDFSHRLRHGSARICCVSGCSVAITAYETENEAIISGVATKPQYRGLGHAKMAISGICNMLQRDGKVPIVLAVGSMVDYYKKLGFKKTGEFAVAKIK